ncbi:MAG TPA: hypothetical protein VKX45_26310 [Bryobacteraceae bacterium]|jgi:hypothetical protein|nr:hypothetical protein [Bryobacteraceae bacterium]
MKTEVYSWRVAPELKAGLEREARRRRISLSAALDLAAQEWLRHHADEAADELQQQRLHEAAARYLGKLASGNPRRSETVRQAVRERLRRRHAR